jgi:hypothetical protein
VLADDGCDTADNIKLSAISGPHGGEYENENLLGYRAVWSRSSRPTFQKCVLPSSSMRLKAIFSISHVNISFSLLILDKSIRKANSLIDKKKI